MRNRQLHAALSAFAEEAAWQLQSDTSEGADLPFEAVAAGRRDSPLYCYRPLTGDFIAERVSLLGLLPSYGPAIGTLSGLGGLEAYLEAHGEPVPPNPRERADSTLRTFLARVFEDSTDFVLEDGRLKRALHELESAIYDRRSETVVIAPLLGLEIASPEVALGDGLAVVGGDCVAGDGPAGGGVARGRGGGGGGGRGRRPAAPPPFSPRGAAVGVGPGRRRAGRAR